MQEETIEHKHTLLQWIVREREQEQEEEVVKSIDLSYKLENSIQFLQFSKKRALSLLNQSQLEV
jgi:hypothetical protein